jgi:hypothetical protein
VGDFYITFRKSGGAREKTNFIERFIAKSTNKIQKEFFFRILLGEISAFIFSGTKLASARGAAESTKNACQGICGR